MNDQEILTKAIEKAIAGGWKPSLFSWIHPDRQPIVDYYLADQLDRYKSIIFNHDFAKALWGEIKPLANGEYPSEMVMYKGKPMWHPWKHHLERMVVADDPIKYLGENI